MLKKIPKIITTIFLVVFLFQLIGFIFILTTPKISQAIEAPKLQVPIGEEFSKVNADDETISVPWIGEYISAVYKYAVGIVGILATVVMMFGGVLWITAGGNQERISNAKSWITASLTGLVLVLCSYLILSTVNPDLTRFKPIEISVVQKPPEVGCCAKIKDSGKGGDTTKDKCETGWKGEKYIWHSDKKECIEITTCCEVEYTEGTSLKSMCRLNWDENQCSNLETAKKGEMTFKTGLFECIKSDGARKGEKCSLIK